MFPMGNDFRQIPGGLASAVCVCGGSIGILWDPLESNGIQWNPLESIGEHGRDPQTIAFP